MKRIWVVGAVASAALCFVLPAAADQSFSDSTGETAGSADVSTVAVANSSTASTVTFTVTTNMPTMEANSEIDIYINSDNNPSTGDAPGLGLDYVIGLDSTGYFIAQWNGSSYTDVANASASVFFNNGVLSFTIPTSFMGSPTTGFGFTIQTLRGPDPNNPIIDNAPDTGEWTYTMVQAPPPPPPPPPAPTVSSVTATFAGTPHAGKSFRATGLTVDLSDGTEVKATGLSCSATLGGKKLVGTGTGHCTFKLAKTAKGKRLVVKVTGKYKSKTLTRTKAFTVH